MRLVKDSQEWFFPPLTGVTGIEFTARNKATEKALQHGAIIADDGKIGSRNIDVEVTVEGTSVADFLAKTDDLKRHIYRTNQQLFITDDRYINVAGITKYKEKYWPGFYLVKGTINITFLAIDPFFYDAAVSRVIQGITQSSTQFMVTNIGNIDTPLTITITANGANPSIMLRNITDNGRMFTYQDVQMIAGQVVVIDTVTGTVKRGENNTINNFSGTFLNLLPGDNLFEYTGAPCTIEIAFQARWL